MFACELAFADVSSEAFAQKLNSVVAAFFGEERPANMLILLAILVILLHVSLILWLLRSDEATKMPPTSLMMEVSMVAVSSPKPSVASPAMVTPRPEKKIEPKKPPVKPIPKKVTPMQKAADVAETVAEQKPAPQNTSAQTSSENDVKTKTVSEEQAFTEAVYNASYLHNPAPEYPSVAKSRGWQGKVKVRVYVSAEGFSEKVELAVSSGHEILDEAAIETVKKYKFKPAKRGDTPVSTTVVVPIDFHFEE